MDPSTAASGSVDPTTAVLDAQRRSAFGAMPLLAGVNLGDAAERLSLPELCAVVAGSQRSPLTREAYARTYRRLAKLAGPGSGVGDITAQLVARFRDELETRGRASATIARELSAVRFLIRAIGGPANALEIKSPKVGRGRPRGLTDEQLARLLAAPDLQTTIGIRDRAILETMGRAGVRRKEVTDLNIDSIQRRADDTSLDATGSLAWSVEIIEGKGGRSHTVPAAHTLVDALGAWLEQREPADTRALFVSIPRTGRPAARLSLKAMNRIVTRYADEADLRINVGPHTLRHTFGRRLGRAGIQLDVIAQLLGHADVRNAMIYTERGDTAAWQAIRLLDGEHTLPPSTSADIRRTGRTRGCATRRHRRH